MLRKGKHFLLQKCHLLCFLYNLDEHEEYHSLCTLFQLNEGKKISFGFVFKKVNGHLFVCVRGIDFASFHDFDI